MIATYTAASRTDTDFPIWTVTYWSGATTAALDDDDTYTWSASASQEQIEAVPVAWQQYPFWLDAARDKIHLWGFQPKEYFIARLRYFRRMMFSKSGWLPARCRAKA